MKSINFFSLCVFIIFLIVSCGKDDMLEEDSRQFNEVTSNKLVQYNDWDETEKRFFEVPFKNQVNLRDRETRLANSYHPLLIEGINYIAKENQRSPFIRAITNKVGFPMWSKAYVHSNLVRGTELISIPFSFTQENKTTAIFILTKENGKYTLDGFAREHIKGFLKNCSNMGVAKQLIISDEENFMLQEQALLSSFCDCENTLSNVSPPSITPDCIWRAVELCSDDATQTGWLAGYAPIYNDHDNDGTPNLYDQDWHDKLDRDDHDGDGILNADDQDWHDLQAEIGSTLPPHLDHDHDGIPNIDDQDWHDFQARYNVTQEELTQYWSTYWGEHLEYIHGPYEQFWNEYKDQHDDWVNDQDGSSGLQDLWDLISLGWSQGWGWFFDDDRDGNGLDDRYDDCDDDWFGYGGDGLKGDETISTRTIRCEWYFVRDCQEGINGDLTYWWTNVFDDIVHCPSCPEGQTSEMLLNLWINSYSELMSIEDFVELMEGCELVQDYEQCVKVKYEENLESLIFQFVSNNQIDPVFAQTFQELLSQPDYCQAPITMTSAFNECLGNKFLEDILLRQYSDLVIDADTELLLSKIGNVHHMTEMYDYLNTNPDYHSEEMSYILWAVANHGNDLAYYLDRFEEFDGINNPFIVQEVPGISILSVSVPTSAPDESTKLCETPFRSGHEYNPDEGIIPEDLQYGTDGNEDLIFEISSEPLGILDKDDDELLDMFYDLLTNEFLNSDLADVAFDYHNRWEAGIGGDYYNAELSNYVLNNPHMKQTALDFGNYINSDLSDQYADNNNNNSVLLSAIDWSDFGSNYRLFLTDEDVGLKILVNDTEQLQVFNMGDFQYNSETKEWEGTFYFRVYDNFGLDNLDLIDFQGKIWVGVGFQAWWILQHIRGYKPFRTEIRHVVKLKGKINE